MSANAIECALQLLNEGETAKVLSVSKACLRRWRAVGQGPPWVRVGGKLVRYDLEKLREWIQRQAEVGR